MLEQVITIDEVNRAPIPFECDAPFLKVVGELPRELNGTLYRNGPNPQFEVAGRALVRRRRHAARLPSGKWPRQLSQPLDPHPEMAGRARRRPRAVRRLRRASCRAPRHRRPADSGVANTNIIFHAGRLLALEEGHPPTEIEPGTLNERGYCDYQRRHFRPLHRTSQDRSGHRRDGVLRLQRQWAVHPDALVRIGQCIRRA